ncbi:GbsR/MarR family transcriptional regulator [Nocardioides limicola]|uniref:GbsR/MarR family transcriptional regulator n=1 Tax=Nocardioides limicola TaxID=2803368 RepID=UPI00193C1E42|nr:MarR family transcriptional regulator [Nocardioides sp. DJM-14]
MANPDAVRQAVERFAAALETVGLQRMPARVFAFILIDDAETYSAKDLAEGLGVSAASISGAVRQLVEGRLIFRESVPGTRADQFRVNDDDLWGTILRSRFQMLDQLIDTVDGAVRLLGVGTPGARRMMETQAWFEFNRDTLGQLLDDWGAQRDRRTEEIAGRLSG